MYGERNRAECVKVLSVWHEEQNFYFSIFFCGCKQPKSIHMFMKSCAKVRISERFAKEMIKREQKKFTFYAEREQINPKGLNKFDIPNDRTFPLLMTTAPSQEGDRAV